MSETDNLELDRLLEKVYKDAGFDFRNYRRSMLQRRLERRLSALHLDRISDYLHYLDTHPDEYLKFIEHLTIKVSGFFRCPYTFQQIAKLVLPELIAHKQGKEERGLKFWSAACARGEEPYSVAILLAQSLGDRRPEFDITIYGSDISRKVLNAAREGIYFAEDLNGLGESLKPYFTRHGPAYVIKPEIREMVTFAHYDLTCNAPLPVSNADCIFCCNVLIYWQRELQAEVLGRLYESLNVPGYLVLGEAETPTPNISSKLKCLDGKARIYQKV